ncbi:hypothetical protein OAJ33_02280 [Acidimicrobiaceae bacterium]|nr:hypothetical protein [Acidimicrobiaceae bacterium]
MFARIEVISNNTYKFNNFTYSIPESLNQDVKIGSIVNIEFRKRKLKGLVIALEKQSNINNLNNILSVVTTLNNENYKYIKYLATINRINMGMLLFNMFDIRKFNKQKIISTKNIRNISFNQFNKETFTKKNIFFVSSLKQSKELFDKLKDTLVVDYYQKFGGQDELKKIINNKNLSNIIVLSNNFEKFNIENDINYYFYDSNANSYKLPKLNELNIIESAYLKNTIFGGTYIFVSEFPNFEFFNEQWKPTDLYDFSIEYFVSNNIKDNMELITHKYPKKIFNYFSNQELPYNKNLNFIDTIENSKVDTIIIQYPNISKNKILNSYKLIYLLKILNFAKKNDLKIIVLSSTVLDINATLNSKSMSSWIKNELDVRQKYGPNNLFKIYSIYSQVLLKNIDSDFFLGPKITNEMYIYELQIKINDMLNYEIFQKIFKVISNSEIKRIRHIS